VVTLPTAFMRGRHTVAMLELLELPELIAKDSEDYLAISSRLLSDNSFHAEMKQKIQERKSRLFNDKSVARAFQIAVETVCRQPPAVGQQPSAVMPLPTSVSTQAPSAA
jgi:predicted O-linked N-acetylglucosamine transferase (SPINDLY family)